MDEEEVRIQQLRDQLAEAEQKRAERLGSPSPKPNTAHRAGKKRDRRTWWMIGGIGVIVLAGFGQLLNAPGPETAKPAADLSTTTTQQPVADASTSPVNFTRWSYSQDRDPMTDRVTQFACVTSSNQVQQDWPYRPVAAELCVRSSPRHGLDVFARLLGDGQVLCRTYSGCTVKIRFDDKAQQSFSAADAADGSTNVIFISNAARMVESLKSAKTTRLEITVYRAGNQVLEFDTEDLDWPRPAN